ncbi:MAG: chromosomal replication initiator protein DnaA [Bacilli bacterium]|nr:chromosomal replication initiator protein DnaA [Bacilli bacterium]MDD4607558.1 chromosomal replication initiator protein DnaA [Bacilli bacterium]
MKIEVIWDSFLNKIKEELKQPLLYDAWFAETKLIELKDDYAKILVPMPIHKKHLKSNYNDLIEKTFNEITGSNFKIEYITEEELEQNIVIDTDNMGVPADVFVSNLDPKHTFDNFIVGESNKFAKYNALAVAEKPGQIYNPLFIYGSSGLGKTHLMHAIGNYIVENSNKKVLYTTSDYFVNDFVELYKHKSSKNNFDIVDKFKEKYRSLDVLIIDDIQYLEIAPTSQQEFFNTFNDLHNNKKQIIIASDRSPDDLRKLEDNLRTRFNWGLTVNIFPPDFELRMNIIDTKIKSYEMMFDFPQDVKEYIASNCTSDIRKLEGAINRVYAYATIMNGSNITLELAIEALKDYFVKSIISKNKIEQVQQLVANRYNITVEDLKSKRRSANIGVPRQIAMYICRIYLEEPFARIGSDFGGKDHTTVMHSVDKITKELQKDPQLATEIENIVNNMK